MVDTSGLVGGGSLPFGDTFREEYSASQTGIPWEVDRFTFVKNLFSITSQETLPQSIAFKPDGTAMYMVGTNSDTVYEYSLSSPWQINTASYTSRSFSVTSQDTFPRSIDFKPDGTAMYMLGENNDTVYEYSLSTAWQIDTASYASRSFSIASQDTGPQSIAFKPDGTAMYVVGAVNDTVYEYSLSTPWQINTASYTSRSFSVASQDTGPQSIAFKPDGTAMYMAGTNSETVYEYSLSTAWQIDTASYASRSFSIASQENNPRSIAFKPDGTAMYMVGEDNDTVYEYSLSTAWQIDTASHASRSFSVASQETAPQSIAFKPDGTAMYMVGVTSRTVYEYSLSTAWQINTANYTGRSFSVASQETSPRSIDFKPDGTAMYMVGITNDTVYEYSLSTAWQINTASYTSRSFSVNSQETSPQSIAFKPDGTAMYMVGVTNDTVYEYSLSTPWKIDTASYASRSFSVVSQEANPQSIAFKPDGTAMYMVGLTNDTVYEYSLSTAWQIDTASYASRSFSIASQEANPASIAFKPDGTAMYMVGSANDTVYEYSLIPQEGLPLEIFSLSNTKVQLTALGITRPSQVAYVAPVKTTFTITTDGGIPQEVSLYDDQGANAVESLNRPLITYIAVKAKSSLVINALSLPPGLEFLVRYNLL